MWVVVYENNVLLGMAIQVPTDRGPLALATINDRWSGDTLEEAVAYTRAEAARNMDTVHRLNRALHRYPVFTGVADLNGGVMDITESMRYGAAQRWALIRKEGQRADARGALYPMPDGTWLNQYRPFAFPTKEAAANDLFNMTNPTQYNFSRG